MDQGTSIPPKGMDEIMTMQQQRIGKSFFNLSSKVLFPCLALLFSTSIMAKDSIEISSSNDFEAPDIAHNLDTDVTRDKKGNVVIRAVVTDEFSVNSVSVFFRDSGNNKYRKRPMLPDTKMGKSVYKADIPKTALSGERIEYYFEADDKVGNKKLKGLEFSPLKREIANLPLINGNSFNIAEKKPEPKKIKTVHIEEPTAAPKPVREAPSTSLDAPMVWIPGF